MGLSEDGEDNTLSRYEELCLDLNLDRSAKEEASESYHRISKNYTLEGDGLHWLACSLYVACRKSVPTVGRGESEGNCVSLTRLLRSAKLSLINFFNKMKKWADMANLPQDFRDKVDRLERNFAVSTVIFKKFEPIFLDIFRDPARDPPRAPRSRKQRRLPCTPSEVFNFCWTMFVQVKGNFPAISDDLVNSYHLLLCCIDWFYANALLSDRRDLLNPSFSGLPPNFDSKDYRPPSEVPCLIQLLCDKHEGLVVEALGIKEYWWKPHLKRLFDKKTLKGRSENITGILEIGTFESNSKAINHAYEMYVLGVGDFDERIFLGEDSSAEIGTPSKQGVHTGDLAERMEVKRLQTYDPMRSLAPSTPLTGRRYLKEKEGQVTPVSTATQSVSRLQTLLSGRKTVPSEILEEVFSKCEASPKEEIMTRVKQMGETFCTQFAQSSDDHPGSHIDFAKKRLQLGESLYYKALENIMLTEKRRLQNKDKASKVFSQATTSKKVAWGVYSGRRDEALSLLGALKEYVLLKRYQLLRVGRERALPDALLEMARGGTLLGQDLFHRSLFACCLEIVIFSYNSQRTFPWIIEVFDLYPYDFYKVIEVLIRAEDGLSRDVVKHLNHIEETILESQAWKADSPLWKAIEAVEGNVPMCEDVTLPSQIEKDGSASVLMSPRPIHPTVKRLAGEGAGTAPPKKDILQSPVAPSAADRFGSPTTGSAKRRLFSAGPAAGSSVTVGTPVNDSHSNDGTSASPAQQILTFQQAQMEDGRQVFIQMFPASAQPAALSAAAVPPAAPAPLPPTAASAASAPENKPRKTGSLALFFRKVYHLVSVRLRDLCERLDVEPVLRGQMWTMFEYTLVHHIDLMCERHVDQVMMCAVYVMAKVTNNDKPFQEIMKNYRLQPQAESHVYRSVLLKNRRRHPSGSSEGSRNGASGSSSPVTTREEDSGCSGPGGAGTASGTKDKKRTEKLSTIRSSSTLPVPHPNSQPPTPTRLAGTGSSFEFEDRGDLIKFYNQVYVKRIKSFALRFSAKKNDDTPPVSPLPLVRSHTTSPRRISTKHSVYVSPHKSRPTPLTPQSKMLYCFDKSPAKDLRAINKMLVRPALDGKRPSHDGSGGQATIGKRVCLGAGVVGAAQDPPLASRLRQMMVEREASGSR